MTPLSAFLYMSRLAPGQNFKVFGDVLPVARRRNVALRITGALVFDGERFCQLLEGATEAVVDVAQRIEADPRHTDFSVLHQTDAAAGRTIRNWQTGYCGANDLDTFDGPGGLRSDAAMAAFVALLPRCDMLQFE